MMKRLLRYATTTVLAVAGTLLGAPLSAHAAAGDPFPAGGSGLVFVAQGPARGEPSTLYQAVQGTGQISFVRQGTASFGYNAMGYRLADNYLYAINDNGALVRVGQGGAATNLGQVGLPSSSFNYNQGTFGEGASADTLFVRLATSDRNLYAVNVAAKTSTRITLSAAVPNLSDFVFTQGYLWGVYGEGRQLYRIDPATGAVLAVATTGLPTNPYGAQWVYGNGNIGISNNVTGTVYQLRLNGADTATPSITVVSATKGPANTQNDGAAYPGLPADLGIVKTGPATWSPGDAFSYTLTVHNYGPGASSGYIVKDQLPANLTNPATTAAGCVITAGVLECAGGSLAVGADGPTITVTGTAPGTAGTDCVVDKIANLAAVTGNEADPFLTNNTATSTACPTGAPVPSFTVAKTADIALPAYARPGDVITYTVTVTNTSDVPYTVDDPASFTDLLTNVLDDATIVPGSLGGPLHDDRPVISWSGPLPARGTVTFTYQVRVDDPPAGDHILTNAVVPGPTGTCATADACEVTTPVADFTVSKTVSTGHASAGDVVAYTITVTNAGAVDFGGTTDPHAPQAQITDSLAGILPDATYNGDANQGGTLTGTSLGWAVDLPVGTSTQLTYSVTVRADVTTGGSLRNTVAPGDLGRCTAVDQCATDTPLASFTVAKTVSATTARPGDKITFTITVTNTGGFAYTDAEPASFSDDLAAVLDDADYNGDATQGATVSGGTLSWQGALAIGAIRTITFSVTVHRPADGDLTLRNVVAAGAGGTCIPDQCATETTVTPVRAYTVAKSVSATSAKPGDKVTYTITVTNTGDAGYTVDDPAGLTDDLGGLLDDATYNDDATEGATVSGATLSWSGPLAFGATVTITYSVTVGKLGAGDGHLRNVVAAAGGTGTCPADCATDTPIVPPVRAYTVAKRVSATSAKPGDKVTYTITVTNTGDIAYLADDPAGLTDDLSGLLDDATYNDDATAGATVDENVLTWSGALAAGARVMITYSVTVADPDRGDRVLTNTTVPTSNGGSCASSGACATRTVVSPPLPVTGTPVLLIGAAGLASIAAGLVLTVLTRRRRSSPDGMGTN